MLHVQEPSNAPAPVRTCDLVISADMYSAGVFKLLYHASGTSKEEATKKMRQCGDVKIHLRDFTKSQGSWSTYRLVGLWVAVVHRVYDFDP